MREEEADCPADDKGERSPDADLEFAHLDCDSTCDQYAPQSKSIARLPHSQIL